MSSKKRSTMTELEIVDFIIEHTYQRISLLEEELTEQIALYNAGDIYNNVDVVKAHLEEAKKVLKKNKEQRLKLRKYNTQTFMIAACLIFAIFLIHGLYSMIFNIN